MCQICGCAAYIDRGPQAVLDRAIAIVSKLGVTLENMQEFEDAERICEVIAAKTVGVDDEEVARIARRVSEFHQENYGKRNRSLASAARDVFSKMPAKGDPMAVITAWHQLEQLCGKLREEEVSSRQTEGIAEIARAMLRVHENPLERRIELLRRYGLEGI